MEDSVKLTDIQRRLLAMSIESGRTMMRVTQRSISARSERLHIRLSLGADRLDDELLQLDRVRVCGSGRSSCKGWPMRAGS
jgi:hypothetical protein